MRLFNFFTRHKVKSAPLKRESISDVISSWISPEGTPVYDAATALSISTAYRCVKVLSESVASLRLQYMKYNEERGIFEETTGNLHYLLTIQPNSWTSAFDFWSQVVQDLLLNGNAYIVPTYYEFNGEQRISELILVRPSYVTHDTIANVYNITDIMQGVSGRFSEQEIVHIKGMSLDGKKGVSVLSYAATTMGVQRTGDTETLTRFSNGGNVRGIVSNGSGSVQGFGEYQDTELEKTAQDLDKRFRRGERVVSVPGQVQWSPMSLSSVDLEFLNTRKFGVREICRFFGVHPSFVFDDTSNNYKSAEMANVAFLSHTLNPLLKKIECELQRKLVSKALCHKTQIHFDRRDLYSLDLEGLADYQTKTLASGVYTINDWRRYENQPPVSDGDTPLVSANLKTLYGLISEGTPSPESKREATKKRTTKKKSDEDK